MKRAGILRNKMLICGACYGKPMPHDDCEKGLCFCYRTMHKAIGVKAVAGDPDKMKSHTLWCQKCDKGYYTIPITQVCELCGGKVKAGRNPMLIRSPRR